MLTRLLDKYEIEASTHNTKIQNDKLDILTQIILVDKLLESLKNEDQRLITFFSEESIFTEVERFCFGLVYDFSFSPDFRQRDQNEIRNNLSLKCFQVLTNIPSSFYSDILSSSLEFNIICSNFLLHNIKCNIMKICSEIIKKNIETTNIDFLDTHFFGFFSQVIFKIMKWNFPIFFTPDIYKQKVTEKNEKSDMNNENYIEKITNDQINIQIDNCNDITRIIDGINKIIEKLGLYLRLNIVHDQEQSKTFITISEITDFSLPNFKYISNLIILNIHGNYAMQEFLVDILKSYPEALPDGTIIKRLSQIACNDFTNINENTNNKEISSKTAEDSNEKSDQDSKIEFNFDLIFDRTIKRLCNSYDACYTLVDIYRTLPLDSPILYQFLDSYVLNNIIKAASMIFEEGKRSADSFKHTALTVGLIEIVTKITSNNSKLLSSIELPSNLIISEGNVNEVTISFIELYLKKNKSESTETNTSSNKPNIQLNRRQSASQNSFTSNMSNIPIFQSQSNNLVKSNSDSKSIDSSKYIIESKLFKLFFTSEKLQNKLITLFFKNNVSTKILSNKSLFQSSSTNCISSFDSSNSFSFQSPIPTSSSYSNSFRYNGFDSYPRSSSIGNWQADKSDQSEEQSFLIALAKVPGLVHGLESALDRERKAHLRLTPKSKANDNNITSSFPIFPLEENGNSSLDSIAVTTSNESSMITSSSYDNLDGSTSSADLNAPIWTPACKFLALELVKLTNADVSIPELDSRKWKSAVTPAIHRFNLILDSTYGYGDSLIARHRSCSMNDKMQIPQPFSMNSTNSPFNRTSTYNSSTFSMNNSSSQLDSRINSFDNVKFSRNFLKSIPEENHIPTIPNNDKNKDEPKTNNNSYENIDEINLIEPLEIEINSDNFESDNQNIIDDVKSEIHKNYPHSLQDKKCFSTLQEKSLSAHAPKSPDFSRYPKPMLNFTKAVSNSSSSDSSSSSSSICNIKMSTQQTLIQKKKNTKEEKSPPPSQPISSSNSEGDDEYIIDI